MRFTTKMSNAFPLVMQISSIMEHTNWCLIQLYAEWLQDSGCPCFKGGPRTMQNLRKRFHLSLTEEVSKISLLDDDFTALT